MLADARRNREGVRAVPFAAPSSTVMFLSIAIGPSVPSPETALHFAQATIEEGSPRSTWAGADSSTAQGDVLSFRWTEGAVLPALSAVLGCSRSSHWAKCVETSAAYSRASTVEAALALEP